MNCPKCGYQNPGNARSCMQCNTPLPAWQQPYQAQNTLQAQYDIPDYMVWSILVTIFCCLIPGIIAIVKSASANSKKNVGDFAGAMQEANAAKTWIWVSVGLGVVGSIIVVLVQAASVLSMGGY